jgi:dihydroorotase
MTSISIARPFDAHVHLREGAMLESVARHTATQFGRALVMPNTQKPILTFEDANQYCKEIISATPRSSFYPLMTVKLTDKTTPEVIRECKGTHVVAGKVYPEGVTTNSEDGVRSILDLYPVFAEMEKVGLVLCLHGEVPGVFCIDREAAFFSTLRDVASSFPRLRVVLEHVTTVGAVNTVASLSDRVAATITVHHMLLTLDDVIGGTLRPHNFCKPVAKREEDRQALTRAATSGDPKFFLETDSAPHSREKKECSSGCAGVFTAPVAMPLLAQIFESSCQRSAWPAALEEFSSTHGAAFYGLPEPKGRLELAVCPWTVPSEYGGVVPFKAGEALRWKVAP